MIERDIEKRAAAYVEDLLPDCISLLCRMTAVEAPTGDEGARAELLRSIFLEAGLDDVSIDDIGNVTGIRRGQTRRAILLEAHMDTVFPRGTVTAAPSVIDGEIHCPGVGDNTVGLVTVITALKVLNHLGIQTRHDLIFAGTVREEGLGNLGGIRRLIDTFRNSLDACITVDGFQYQDIVYKGSGIHTERICFNGRGGHSAERDIYPQALLAAAAAADATDNRVYKNSVSENSDTEFLSYSGFNFPAFAFGLKLQHMRKSAVFLIKLLGRALLGNKAVL
jgi:acetylornithine deacetylase/succinyl-diaminopimelate desuccinylase-like protein